MAAERLGHSQVEAGVYLCPMAIWKALPRAEEQVWMQACPGPKSNPTVMQEAEGSWGDTLIALEGVVRRTASHRTWPIYPGVSLSVAKGWFV